MNKEYKKHLSNIHIITMKSRKIYENFVWLEIQPKITNSLKEVENNNVTCYMYPHVYACLLWLKWNKYLHSLYNYTRHVHKIFQTILRTCNSIIIKHQILILKMLNSSFLHSISLKFHVTMHKYLRFLEWPVYDSWADNNHLLHILWCRVLM